MNNSEVRHITLPIWLDNLLFNKLSAIYSRKKKRSCCPWLGTRGYLGLSRNLFPKKLFWVIPNFSKYLQNNYIQYQDKEELSVFDFGGGTGGELVGFIIAVSEQLSSIKKIRIKALDGNAHALRNLEQILDVVSAHTEIKLDCQLMPVVIDDFYDWKLLQMS